MVDFHVERGSMDWIKNDLEPQFMFDLVEGFYRREARRESDATGRWGMDRPPWRPAVRAEKYFVYEAAK